MRGRRTRARALSVVALAALWGCAPIVPPEPLVELRSIAAAPNMDRGREAAPDLIAEAERSLAAAERALAAGDAAAARRLATLGTIQARTAFAIARAQEAQRREDRARQEIVAREEDIARYRAQRRDAEREIRRLEALRERDPRAEPAGEQGRARVDRD